MNIVEIGGRKAAVCISQGSFYLVLPDGTVSGAGVTPTLIDLTSESTPADTGLGFHGVSPPTFGAPRRALTPEEMAADAIFVTQLPGFVPALRAAGFRGAILAPGLVSDATLSDGRVVKAARHDRVVVLSPALPSIGEEQAQRVLAASDR
jgi:hypothetical protein